VVLKVCDEVVDVEAVHCQPVAGLSADRNDCMEGVVRRPSRIHHQDYAGDSVVEDDFLLYLGSAPGPKQTCR
jgi:hypothetical protein